MHYKKNLDTTRGVIGQKPMGYCAGKLKLLLLPYFYKTTDRIFHRFTGAINIHGMLGEHSKIR